MDNVTDVVFILDRSGSMAGLEKDTIGGFNGFLDGQKKNDGKINLTTILFDDKYEVLHDRVNLRHTEHITSKDYFVRGMTALLDAIGKTIYLMRSKPETDKVIFVITTDGMENSSREFSFSIVKELIEKQRALGWEFIFLGANIDSFAIGHNLGISGQTISNFSHTSRGVGSTYRAVTQAVNSYSTDGKVDTNWNENVE